MCMKMQLQEEHILAFGSEFRGIQMGLLPQHLTAQIMCLLALLETTVLTHLVGMVSGSFLWMDISQWMVIKRVDTVMDKTLFQLYMKD